MISLIPSSFLINHPQISFMSVPGAKEVGINLILYRKLLIWQGAAWDMLLVILKRLTYLASLKSHIDYGVFYPIQKAAEIALNIVIIQCLRNSEEYEKRRDIFISGLEMAGWKVAKSPATMFIWAKIPSGWTSRQFAFELIEKSGVAVVPGDAFGQQGEGYVRIALFKLLKNLTEAAKRIQRFLY